MKLLEKNNKLMIPVKAPIHIYMDLSFFEGDILDVQKRINDFIPDHKKFINELNGDVDENWKSISKYVIDIDRHWQDIDVDVKFYRLETDEEYEKRIKMMRETIAKRKETIAKRKEKEKMKTLKKEEQERELYEKLKKKFENE